MNFFWTKTPIFIQKLFSNYIWKIKNAENKIFLTFDDGPIPIVTEWVLAVLKKENVKATFFCIGDNIKKHPEIFNSILCEGHTIGNHTFNHLNGWKTSTNGYLENFKLCDKMMEAGSWKKEAGKRNLEVENAEDHKLNHSKIFRPPYGKIKPSQASEIIKMGYKIIMWDVLSYDFNPKVTTEKCLENVIKNTSTGSIIVFHDSLKAYKNLESVLPKAIQLLKQKGFVFDVIT